MNGQIAGFLVIYGIALCIARKLCDKFFNRMPKGRITMTLKDTAKLMVSDDYKDRFRAEYFQLKIRYDSLRQVVRYAEQMGCRNSGVRSYLLSQSV